MSTFKTYKIDKKILNGITTDEKKVLPILTEAVKMIGRVFALQENENFDGANFYPHDAAKQEIEEAARKDSRIFSPFTVVERVKSGQLVAIDYHQKYQKTLLPIVNLLRQAAKITQNNSLRKYLETCAKSLTDGSYQQMDISWLNIKETNLCISIGAFERNLDKRSYQAHIGVTDTQMSKKARLIRDILYATIAPKPKRIMPPSIVDLRVNHTIVFSGFLSLAGFSQSG